MKAALRAQKKKLYLREDGFNAATISPLFKIVDPNGIISPSGGSLRFGTGPGAWTHAAFWPKKNPTPGTAIMLGFTCPSSGSFQFGWGFPDAAIDRPRETSSGTTTTGSTSANMTMRVSSAKAPNASVDFPNFLIRGQHHRFLIVKLETLYAHIVYGGRWSQPRLVRLDNRSFNAPTTQAPELATYDANAIDAPYMLMAKLGGQWLTDTGIAMDAFPNPTAGKQLANIKCYDHYTLYQWTPATSTSSGKLMLRWEDDDNCIFVLFDATNSGTATAVQLVKREGGVETTYTGVGTTYSAQTFTAGTQYTFHVYNEGASVRVDIDDTKRAESTVVTYKQYYMGRIKTSVAGSGYFACYPLTLTTAPDGPIVRVPAKVDFQHEVHYVTVDRSVADPRIATSLLDIGYHGTQYLAEPGGNAAALSNVYALTSALGSQCCGAMHLYYGSGGVNPQPTSASAYSFTFFLNRIARIQNALGNKPMAHWWGFPGWMSGHGDNGSYPTNGGYHPTSGNYTAAANMIVAALKACIDQGTPLDMSYFGNEMMGYGKPNGSPQNQPTLAHITAYTDAYNATYDAIKAAATGAYTSLANHVLAGPYLTLNQPFAGPLRKEFVDALTYFVANKHGTTTDTAIVADYGLYNSDDPTQTPEEVLRRTPEFATMYQNMAALAPGYKLQCSEIYLVNVLNAVGVYSDELQGITEVSILYNLLLGGCSLATHFQPETDPNSAPGNPYNWGLWTRTDSAPPVGGQPTSAYDGVLKLRTHFPSGTALKKVVSTSPLLECLASSNKLMIINKFPTAQTVMLSLDGGAATPVTIPRYKWAVVDLPYEPTSPIAALLAAGAV